MKILFVGLGSIGKRHLSNLQMVANRRNIDIEVILYRSSNVVNNIPYKQITDYELALAENPDVVFICNPTHLHLDFAIKAANKGCHLFIEKPLSHSLEKVDDLINVTHNKENIVLVGCNMRFHPGLKLVKKLIDNNTIGDIYSVSASVGQYLPDWRPNQDYRLSYSAKEEYGGGAILDLIHELDYVYWLIGDVSEVCALSGKVSKLEIETEDIAEILLRTKNGIFGHIHLDYLQRDYSRNCKIIGEYGTILWDYKEEVVKHFDIRKQNWKVYNISCDRNDMYVEEIEHFFDCIIYGHKPLIPIEEGKRVLEIAIASKKSSILKRFIAI